MEKHITLGIECTAHTVGIGIFSAGRLLSNEVRTYSQKFGGMKPSDAADHHSLVFEELLLESAEKAGIGLREISLVGYSKGPGLAPCLRVGRTAAVLISSILKIPVIPVHHSVAHIEAGRHFSGLADPLTVYTSGGNTQILVKEKDRYRVLGETLDIGLGNAIDTLARAMGLEKAHGGEIERLAEKGKYIELPYTVKGMDFAFTGLTTRAGQLLPSNSREDIAHSFQETAFAMLCEAAERALMLTRKGEVLLCGGVAQNRRLQRMLREMCAENGVKFGVAEDGLNRDNGGMIAYTADYLHGKYKGKYPDGKIDIDPNYRIEDSPA